MVIKNISLSSFRNYSRLNLDLGPNMNIFIGNNAQGKTNILESICVLALSKTYKDGVEPNIITFHKNKTVLKAKVKKNNLINKLEIAIEPNKKILKLNNQEVKKISDYISNLNIIMFTPDDLEIIKGSPHIRRNLLNMELSQISKKYLNTYNEYNKILKIRNEYLKLMQTSYVSDKSYLEVVTEQLIEKAIFIYQEREKYLGLVNQNIESIYKKITSLDHLFIKYEPNFIIESFDYAFLKEKLREIYQKNSKKEISYGLTLYGPHRDNFSFYLDGVDLKYYGSQGQQKIAVIAYKLSEISIFKEYTSSSPVLLLDDIFSELDISKRNKLLDYISKDIQSIITTTDLKNIRKRNLDDACIFEIIKGNIERR